MIQSTVCAAMVVCGVGQCKGAMPRHLIAWGATIANGVRCCQLAAFLDATA